MAEKDSKFHGKKALPTRGKCLLEPGVPSLLGYVVLWGNWVVVLLLTSQAGCSSHNDLSLWSKTPLSNLRFFLCALALDLATVYQMKTNLACSTFVSRHNGFHGGLPLCPSLLGTIWESLFSSFLCRILCLTFPVSENLPLYSAYFSAEV